MTERKPRRAFICTKGDCTHPENAWALEEYMNDLLEEHGLDSPAHPHYTTCTIGNCLGACQTDTPIKGPSMIVHPEAVRYYQLTNEAIERIVKEHLLQDKPVEDFLLSQPEET